MLDPDFAPRLALSYGRQLLEAQKTTASAAAAASATALAATATASAAAARSALVAAHSTAHSAAGSAVPVVMRGLTSTARTVRFASVSSPNATILEVKRVDDDDQPLTRTPVGVAQIRGRFSSTPVHDMRAPEPASRAESTSEADTNADIKDRYAQSRAVDDEEKPSWEEVMRSTADGPLLLLPQATGALVPTSQRAHNSGTHIAPLSDDDASVSASMVDALRNSIKRDMNEAISEAISEASVAHQSRIDSLDAKITSKIEQQFSEQSRMVSERFGDIEQMISRLERVIQHTSPPAQGREQQTP